MPDTPARVSPAGRGEAGLYMWPYFLLLEDKSQHNEIMPELPDVETFRRFLNRTAIGQAIEKIDVQETDSSWNIGTHTSGPGPRKEVRLNGPSWEVRVCLASTGARLSRLSFRNDWISPIIYEA